MTKTINRVMFVLAIVGIIMAVYVLQSFLRGTPIVCVNSGCELVRKNPASYIAGIPIPAFGLVGYTIIAILTFVRTLSQNKNLLKGILATTLFGVGFVAWFTYVEIAVIQAICTWCALSGVNMLILFILSVKSYTIQIKEQQSS